ncbi:hypothetical protein GCM10011326_44760 [Salipiger profundus]|nr:hypothetical protein GCM10011326_44760 [Salipiger profundus]
MERIAENPWGRTFELYIVCTRIPHGFSNGQVFSQLRRNMWRGVEFTLPKHPTLLQKNEHM